MFVLPLLKEKVAQVTAPAICNEEGNWIDVHVAVDTCIDI